MNSSNKLLAELMTVADNPENRFDGIIAENKRFLGNMDLKSLRSLKMLREKGIRLCKEIPFSREEIDLLLEAGEVSADGAFAELESYFCAAEYIFSYYNGKDF